MADGSWKYTTNINASNITNKDGLVGSSQNSDFNYKETVTTSFAWETAVCTKCIRTQNCETPRRNWCKKWGQEKETCTEIQF